MVEQFAQQRKDESAAAKGTRASPKVAIAGVGGYAGGELVRLLLGHPRFADASPLLLGRAAEHSAQGVIALEQLHPQLGLGGGRALPPVVPFNWDAVAEAGVDLVFLALPHEISRETVPAWIERGMRVIDLSGAWRLCDAHNRAVYRFAGAESLAKASLQEEAVYGSPELHRDRIASARLVANPGCYATSIILALAPLVKSGLVDLDHGIVCDSKSGVSGAGKEPTAKTHFMYAADNLSAYSVFGHRHVGEMLEQLNLTSEQIQFTPHLLPIPRGIFSTIYLRLHKPASPEEISRCFNTFYASCPLVRLRDSNQLPQIQHVVRNNYCDIGFVLSEDGMRLVVVSCLDNLLKGASGQAIQNMNLMYGWGEEEGLL